MISNFKQHFRGVTTSIVAPPVLLFAKVSARRAKYKAKVQKTFAFISEPPPNLRVSESARRAKYKAKVQKLSLLFPSRRLTCAWVEVQGERNTS